MSYQFSYSDYSFSDFSISEMSVDRSQVDLGMDSRHCVTSKIHAARLSMEPQNMFNETQQGHILIFISVVEL